MRLIACEPNRRDSESANCRTTEDGRSTIDVKTDVQPSRTLAYLQLGLNMPNRVADFEAAPHFQVGILHQPAFNCFFR